MNVSAITAYNMLKRLESKGVVRARSTLPHLRVGRSRIVFEVTPQGRTVLTKHG